MKLVISRLECCSVTQLQIPIVLFYYRVVESWSTWSIVLKREVLCLRSWRIQLGPDRSFSCSLIVIGPWESSKLDLAGLKQGYLYLKQVLIVILKAIIGRKCHITIITLKCLSPLCISWCIRGVYVYTCKNIGMYICICINVLTYNHVYMITKVPYICKNNSIIFIM